ncbi:MAG: response regulator [Desulfamplus sp.]|nr:response regulator [Desulfamplus sp.]
MPTTSDSDPKSSISSDPNLIVFADEVPSNLPSNNRLKHSVKTIKDNGVEDGDSIPPWKILIVDDEKDVHYITKKALENYSFQERNLFFLHSFSSREAAATIKDNPDIALILLDVTMESDDAGLKLIHYIRKKLNNSIAQIVIRTGQPGQAPEQKVIEDYDINDYRLKTELTSQKLHTLVTASLRSFELKSRLQRELEYRETVESSLRESRERFRDIALSTGDWIWETDDLGKYTYLSDNVEQLTGYTASELIHKHFSHLMSPETKDNALKIIEEQIASGSNYTNIETIKIAKDSKNVYLLTSGKPVHGEDGTITGYRGVDKDITGIKLAEKEKEKLLFNLKESQRLEALGTLAGGIAHDFNNILGSILGYAQLLQMDAGGNEKSMRYTQQIINGCNRAKNLTLQILEFSRQRESQNAVQTPVLVSSMLKEKVKLLHASIPSSINIITKIDKDAGYILASPTDIHQIIMNLATNSMQAMDNGQGNITIGIQNITIDNYNAALSREIGIPYGEYVAIFVEDDGKGMSPETIEKVFDPYFTTKTGGDGTGLGLSVVHGIVKRSHGGIKIESAVGSGTKITICFPRQFPEKKKTVLDGMPIQTGEGKVLFVDDEQMLVDLGKMMLERIGYEALAVKSSRNALEIIQKNPNGFDLVITDLTMPDIQGIQLAEKIKTIRPELPIILVTGFSDITTTAKASSSCIDAVLAKPLSINSLAMTLQKLLPRKI